MGGYQPYQKAGVIVMGGEAASPTNPEKGRAGKCKTKNSDHLKDVSTGDHKL